MSMAGSLLYMKSDARDQRTKRRRSDGSGGTVIMRAGRKLCSSIDQAQRTERANKDGCGELGGTGSWTARLGCLSRKLMSFNCFPAAAV